MQQYNFVCSTLLFSWIFILVNFPKNITGVIDNSGIEFFYTSTPRQHDAGILIVGHSVDREMIIPPNTASYYIVAECSDGCTKRVCSN